MLLSPNNRGRIRRRGEIGEMGAAERRGNGKRKPKIPCVVIQNTPGGQPGKGEDENGGGASGTGWGVDYVSPVFYFNSSIVIPSRPRPRSDGRGARERREKGRRRGEESGR
jgi:hypothetical protein